MTNILNDYKIIIMACLTLGLAPFLPEPHIWGKIKWIAGGAVDMKPRDYFDTVLHGTPWVLLIRLGILKLWQLIKGRSIA